MKAAAIVSSVFMLIVPMRADSQDDPRSVKAELDAIKQNEKEIQRNLQIIQDILIVKAPPLENVFVSLDGSPARGDSAAKVVIVEFADYQCPYCGHASGLGFRYYRITLFKKANSAGCAFPVKLNPNRSTSAWLAIPGMPQPEAVRPDALQAELRLLNRNKQKNSGLPLQGAPRLAATASATVLVPR